MLLDAELLGDELAVLIREHVVDAMKPLLDEIATLKASLAAFVVPKDGKDADPELVRAEVARAVAEIPKPEDGKSVDVGVLFTEIGAAVARAVEAQPKPRDGKDADPEEIRAEIARQVAILPRPRDGKDFDPAALDVALARATEETHGFIAEQIEKRIAALPESVDESDVETMINMSTQAWRTELIAEFQKRLDDLPKPQDGTNGKDADPEFIRAEVAAQVALVPKPADGKDGKVDIDTVRMLVKAELGSHINSIPTPRDGKDVEPEVVAQMVADAVAQLPKPINGKDGADADPEFIRATIAAEMAMLPKPVDGKSIDPIVVEQMVASAVAQIPKPADGKSVDPQAVATMIRAEVERTVAEMPAPQNGTDGEPGRDGHDGVQLEDIDIELKGDRTLVFSLMSGGKAVEKEVKLPWPIDRGSFKSGKHYDHGDCVTYAGNLWIATADTSEAPGVGPAALWRMAVKRGKDGRGADAS